MNTILEKVKTTIWFAQRPSFWPHMVALARRQFDGSKAHELKAPEAAAWAKRQAVSVEEALRTVGVLAQGEELPEGLPKSMIASGETRAQQASVTMGGSGDLDLIYQAILATDAKRVVETGVAYGWSSMAALAALEQTKGKLVSVDMPYPKAGNEADVGIVVPDEWRARWTLIREPDRNGVRKALARFGGEIDLAHFDSDKTYVGRMFAFPLLWRALRSGGLFISDDIQDNFGFRDFCAQQGVKFAITESGGKFVGVCRKP